MRSYRGVCAALCCTAGLNLSDGLALPEATNEPRAPVPRPLSRTVAAERAAACVTAADAALYAQHGAAVVRGAFDAACVAELRLACDEVMRRPGPLAEDLTEEGYALPPPPADGSARRYGYFTDMDTADRMAAVRRFALEGGAAAVAGRLSGSATERFLQDQFFVKQPLRLGGGATQWHQDAPYCAVAGDQVVSVFIALDAVPDARECLQFVAGSHAGPELPAPLPPAAAAALDALPLADLAAAEAHPNGRRLLAWPLAAGDCVGFAGKTVHGGPGGWRRALTLRFAGDNVRWAARPPLFSGIFADCGEGGLCDGELLADSLPREGLARGPGLAPLFPLVWEEGPAAAADEAETGSSLEEET